MTEHSVPRFPLEWPAGWTRTTPHRRIHASFRTKQSTTGRLSVIQAIARLEAEVERLGGRNPTLSTNVSLRLDGRPRSDEDPRDPGVALYFGFKAKATVFACDRYIRVADNIAAIAAHIDALRRVERYGVGRIEQALAGYKALPADTAADWRMVLFGVKECRVGVEDVHAAFRARAKEVHPDITKDDGAAMAHLNRARDYALTELGA
jgi:hypothetical protein